VLYFLAIVLPPVAVLLCRKPVQFLLNLILTLCFWIPGSVHALFVVNAHLADKRTKRLEDAIERAANKQIAAGVAQQESATAEI
jgi:uncharacterized membrane protein YqaE (UPF0057 family)